MLSLAVDKPVMGDLELLPLGPAGTPEPDYLLPIKEVVRQTEGGSNPVTFVENTLRDLDLDVGVTQFEISGLVDIATVWGSADGYLSRFLPAPGVGRFG